MSNKTKRQKILAELRRKTSVPHEPLPIQTQSIYSYPVQETRQDLTKTILLSILAISFEIALYFFFEKNISLPLK